MKTPEQLFNDFCKSEPMALPSEVFKAGYDARQAEVDALKAMVEEQREWLIKFYEINSKGGQMTDLINIVDGFESWMGSVKPVPTGKTNNFGNMRGAVACSQPERALREAEASEQGVTNIPPVPAAEQDGTEGQGGSVRTVDNCELERIAKCPHWDNESIVCPCTDWQPAIKPSVSDKKGNV